MGDANKSDLTRRMTAAAARWMADRGFKPVESEVWLARKWIADLAGAIIPTRTEAIALKLIDRKPPDRFRIVGKPATLEYRDAHHRWEAQYDNVARLLTAAVEVKASRADFVADGKWARAPETHLLYVVLPPTLIDSLKVPDGIGVLAYRPKQEEIRCVRGPLLREIPQERIAHVVYQIAIRRDHFTRYERFREYDRQARSHENGRINRVRVGKVVAAVRDVLTGKRTPAEAMDWHNIEGVHASAFDAILRNGDDDGST